MKTCDFAAVLGLSAPPVRKESFRFHKSTSRPSRLRGSASEKGRDEESKLKSKEREWEEEGSGREGGMEGVEGRERWCTESCHWCENSMDGRQTLEAIFTSSANSDRLPPPAPSRISAALSHERTSLFPHFHPSQTIGCHCSSKYPNNMLFFSKLGCISELSMMGLKMTSNGPVWFSLHRVARNMFGYERSGKRERIQKKNPRVEF